MVFSGEKGLNQNCPLNVRFTGNKVECCCFSMILAVPINGIIYYSITFFANALENAFTQVEQTDLGRGGGKGRPIVLITNPSLKFFQLNLSFFQSLNGGLKVEHWMVRVR